MTEREGGRDDRNKGRQGLDLSPLCCPVCSSELADKDESLVCGGCAQHYPVVQGIVDFRLSPGGRPAASEPEALPAIKAATPDGWADAVSEFLRGRDDGLDQLDALTADRRQAWKIFLDLKAGGRLLCLGCGSGGVVQSLVPHADQIVVLDQAIDRVRFAQQRLAIFKPQDEVTFLTGSGAGRLPFATGYFDTVIVTEYGSPDEAGWRLDEARRVLRAEGQFLVVADNRFSFSLPVGWWDRWSTAYKPLPQLARVLGLLDSWWRKRSGPQSLPSLSRQLKSVGFTDLETIGLWPGRSQLDEFYPSPHDRPSDTPDEALPLKARFKRKWLHLPAHCVVAQAGGRRRCSTLERILTDAARQLSGEQDAAPLVARRQLLTRKDKLVIFSQHDEGSLVLRIPLSAAAAAAEERHAATIKHLAASHPGIAPRPLAGGRTDAIDYRVETSMPGTSLKQYLRERGPIDHLKRVSDLLDALNPEGSLRREKFEGANYESMVEEPLERLSQVLRNSDLETQLRRYFRNQLHGALLPFGLLHGDFSNSNIYLSDEAIGVIDWEASALSDLPILDSITYLESSLRPTFPRYSLAEGLQALASRKLPGAEEERFLLDRYEHLGIDIGCHAGLVYLTWLRALDHLLPYWLRFHPEGQQRYIHDVVRVLLSRTSTH